VVAFSLTLSVVGDRKRSNIQYVLNDDTLPKLIDMLLVRLLSGIRVGVAQRIPVHRHQCRHYTRRSWHDGQLRTRRIQARAPLSAASMPRMQSCSYHSTTTTRQAAEGQGNDTATTDAQNSGHISVRHLKTLQSSLENLGSHVQIKVRPTDPCN
jgi:hypothetical protein